MSDESTIRELAEVIADYSSELRDVRDQLEAELVANVDLEVKLEDAEKARAECYADLIALGNKYPHFGMGADLEELVLKHFKDLV